MRGSSAACATAPPPAALPPPPPPPRRRRRRRARRRHCRGASSPPRRCRRGRLGGIAASANQAELGGRHAAVRLRRRRREQRKTRAPDEAYSAEQIEGVPPPLLDERGGEQRTHRADELPRRHQRGGGRALVRGTHRTASACRHGSSRPSPIPISTRAATRRQSRPPPPPREERRERPQEHGGQQDALRAAAQREPAAEHLRGGVAPKGGERAALGRRVIPEFLGHRHDGNREVGAIGVRNDVREASEGEDDKAPARKRPPRRGRVEGGGEHGGLGGSPSPPPDRRAS